MSQALDLVTLSWDMYAFSKDKLAAAVLLVAILEELGAIDFSYQNQVDEIGKTGRNAISGLCSKIDS